jgi:hypothetical protein
MEVRSSIAKTFKRFTIPRSTSSIGTFTTSNGAASSNTEQNLEEITSTHHKHPPLSYVQHTRSHHSHQNLTRPLSEDISSFMIRSTSTDLHLSANEYTSKKSKVRFFKNSNLSKIDLFFFCF